MFRGQSDTEVLLHAYDAWGLAGLERLEGIFAFALWDAARHRLVLMRDRLGVKPLYYAERGERLAFGSEIKAVLAGIDADRSPDAQALAEYLWYGNAFEERTLYRGVRVLPPGHRLVVEQGRRQLQAWWRVESWLERPRAVPDTHAAAAQVREAVDAAVARQLVSDVPVGLFLSGGVDSSSIAAAAAQAGGQPLRSFAVGFDYERGVNELGKAQRVARHFGFEHHELQVRGDRLEEVIVELVRAHDEPFADAANIPLFLLARTLHGSIKVVPQGDGGDEMFGGYRRYALLHWARLWQLWPAVLGALLSARRWSGRTGGAPRRSRRSRRSRDAYGTVADSGDTARPPDCHAARRGARPTHVAERPVCGLPALRTAVCRRRPRATDAAHRPHPAATLAVPRQGRPCHHGAGNRSARAAARRRGVAALAVALPADLKVRGLQKKILLREAMRPRLPPGIVDAPKTGFGVPYEEWLRTSLHGFARAALLADDFIERYSLDRARLRQALDEHAARRRERGFLLWKLLQLALWSRQYLA